MAIEFSLPRAIEALREKRHWTDEQIAEKAQIRRAHITNLRNGKAKEVQLDQINKILGLLANEFQPEEIPGLLLQTEPGLKLVLHGAKTGGIVLGRRSDVHLGGGELGYVITFDTLVAAELVEDLSNHVKLKSRFIQLPRDETEFSKTQREAVKAYDKLHVDKADDKGKDSELPAIFYVGSQRANLGTELYVASRWNTKPFAEPKNDPVVPFFLRYRKDAQPRSPSCFGGADAAFRAEVHFPAHDKRSKDDPRTEDRGEGIYYCVGGKWFRAPFDRKKGALQTCGVVVVSSAPLRKDDTNATRTEIAFIGYSGEATYGCCNALLKRPADFWPPATSTRDDGRVSAFLCTFETELKPGHDFSTPLEPTNIIELDGRV
jgi:transcriptional regulator with XRE-family HTH domain